MGDLNSDLNLTRRRFLELAIACAAFNFTGCMAPEVKEKHRIELGGMVNLPPPRYDGPISLEAALLRRRSIRTYSGGDLKLEEISQLLWAAQGITSPLGFRTAPSAGALYPLELYLAAGDVEDIDKGVYKYISKEHALIKIREGDVRIELASAAVNQRCVFEAAVDIVFTAVYERTTMKYGERGRRYVHLEAGHAAQNVYLQAVSLNLGAVVIGAFLDEEVKKILNIQEEPLYIIPIGRKA
ncbi:MAG: SagB/ThcOx family dehydrogenase [Methanocellales archaeon]